MCPRFRKTSEPRTSRSLARCSPTRSRCVTWMLAWRLTYDLTASPPWRRLSRTSDGAAGTSRSRSRFRLVTAPSRFELPGRAPARRWPRCCREGPCRESRSCRCGAGPLSGCPLPCMIPVLLVRPQCGADVNARLFPTAMRRSAKLSVVTATLAAAIVVGGYRQAPARRELRSSRSRRGSTRCGITRAMSRCWRRPAARSSWSSSTPIDWAARPWRPWFTGSSSNMRDGWTSST